MRIGIDCRALQEPQPSGVSVYTRRIVEELIQLPETRDHTFVLYFSGATLRGEGQYADYVRRIRYDLARLREQHGGRPVEFRIRTAPSKMLKITQLLFDRPRIRWMFGAVDAVFMPTFKFFPVRDSSTPVVLTVHDLSFDRYPEYFNMRRRIWHRLLRPHRLAKNAARLIAVSESTKQDIVDLYAIDQEKIAVVHSGVDTATRVATTDSHGRTFVALSTIEPRKNIEALLDAFELVRKQLPGSRLIVAGGAGWKSEAVLERMRNMEAVEYRGYISDEEKEELLLNAAAFVYPSFYEGFGFPPLEAQQYGVPVIVGAHSSLPEVLRDSALYADVLNVDSLARAMNAAITDTELRMRLRITGFQNVRRFDWRLAASAVWVLLEQEQEQEQEKK